MDPERCAKLRIEWDIPKPLVRRNPRELEFGTGRLLACVMLRLRHVLVDVNDIYAARRYYNHNEFLFFSVLCVWTLEGAQWYA